MIKKMFFLTLGLIVILTGCSRNKDDYSLYNEVYKNADYIRLYDRALSEVRGAFAYITDDDMPELLVSDGDYEAARVSVFTVNDGKIEYIGTFGSWCGRIDFVEKRSYIESGYGNHGGFYSIYTDISDGVKLVGDLFSIDRVDGTTLYYADFSEEGLNGDNRFDYLMYSVPDEYAVSEEEYNKRLDELENMKSGTWQHVSYGEMQDIETLVGEK